MAIPLDAAAAAMRDAMRETVRRNSFWYLMQCILMVVRRKPQFASGFGCSRLLILPNDQRTLQAKKRSEGTISYHPSTS
jgi:hypothetical protein